MHNDQRQSELRQLRREVAAADDRQVRQLVAVVDAAPDRGDADLLIAPLRRRLAVLRPPRPLRFNRLLFMPIDPLIQPASVWRPGAIGVPRSVVPALSGLTMRMLGAELDRVQAMIAGHSTHDRRVIAAAGAQLWPLAGQALRAARPPDDWIEATGLPVAEFAPLAGGVGVLLAEGPALWELCGVMDEAIELDAARRLLGTAAAAGSQPLAMMLAVLLARLPKSGYLMRLADEMSAAGQDVGRIAPDRALDFLIAGIEAQGRGGGSAQTDAEGFLRSAALLETMLDENSSKPSRVVKLEKVRRQLDEQCRATFATAAEQLLAVGKTDEAASSPAACVASREAQARQLRRVDAVGRRLGGAQFYETRLRQVAERFAREPAVTPIERLRLAEILLGPDMALSLFGVPLAATLQLDGLLQAAARPLK